MEVMSEMNVDAMNDAGRSIGAANPNDEASDTSSDLEFHDAIERNEVIEKKTGRGYDAEDMVQRCKYIPMRLSTEERQLLMVLQQALAVSEYTDQVDIFSRKPKVERILNGLVDMLSICSGLMVANNLSRGENLMKNKTLANNIDFFRDMFEVGRRYKIMNPAKMRETYGKMMFLLQDTTTSLIQAETGLSFIKPISTVYSYLEAREGLDMLRDPLVAAATATVADADAKNREVIVEAKQRAITLLCEKYVSGSLSAENIALVLDSISDINSYHYYNTSPVSEAIHLLTTMFHPEQPTDDFSLQLDSFGKPKTSAYGGFSGIYGYSSRYFGGGAKLSHDHKTQYRFVHQSLLLWKEIMSNMPRLWLLADGDMLTESYRLADTGQGYNRLQSCPRVGREMQRILSKVQNSVSGWVGLSVVHLGDRDVPNALVFIDKYSQVPRILAPITACLNRIPLLIEDTAFHAYVKAEWGSLRGLQLQILSDFFKHGFDGSGDDGGSCIDGRLTSAWNWCSKLHKKPYYYVFMFTGFQGFDGDWKEN